MRKKPAEVCLTILLHITTYCDDTKSHRSAGDTGIFVLVMAAVICGDDDGCFEIMLAVKMMII